MQLTLEELKLLNTASAYNGEQHKAICGKAVLELIEYKTIEKDLGIDLITLCKHRTLAEIVGYVWYKLEHPKSHKQVIIKRQVHTFQDNGLIIVKSYDEDYCCGLRIKDYGKTWALTKEELENE